MRNGAVKLTLERNKMTRFSQLNSSEKETGKPHQKRFLINSSEKETEESSKKTSLIGTSSFKHKNTQYQRTPHS